MPRLSLFFLLLTACGKKKAPEPAAPAGLAAPAAPAAPAPSTAGVVPGADLEKGAVRVTLLEAGAPPHEPLRYTPPAGAQGGMRISMDIDTAVDAGGLQIPMDMPEMIVDMDLSVSAADAATDEIVYTTEIVGVDLGDSDFPAPLVAELRSGLEQVVGLTSTVTMNGRGEAQAVRYDMDEPSEATAMQLEQLNRSAQSLSQPFPTEAVGIGGQWEVLRHTESNGVSVIDRALVTLAEKDGDTLTLTVQSTQQMLDTAISLPDMPPDTATEVVHFVSSGTGEQRVQLSSLLPLEGNATQELQMRVEATSEEMQTTVGTEMVMETRITRR